MIDTEVDLAELAQMLARLPESFREGFVLGKTACRDAVLEALDCSEVEAEDLVDTLVLRGLLRFDVSQLGPAMWTVVTHKEY